MLDPVLGCYNKIPWIGRLTQQASQLWRWGAWSGGVFLIYRRLPPCCVLIWWREWALKSLSSYKGTNPSVGPTSKYPKYMGVRLEHTNWESHRSQSMADTHAATTLSRHNCGKCSCHLMPSSTLCKLTIVLLLFHLHRLILPLFDLLISGIT